MLHEKLEKGAFDNNERKLKHDVWKFLKVLMYVIDIVCRILVKAL